MNNKDTKKNTVAPEKMIKDPIEAPREEVLESKKELKPLEAALLEKPVEMIHLPLEEVNNFINVISVVMINDVRSEVLTTHFTNLLFKNNPQLRPVRGR